MYFQWQSFFAYKSWDEAESVNFLKAMSFITTFPNKMVFTYLVLKGLGLSLDLKSGEGSLEITIRFWTVNFVFSVSESSDTSNDVMAVIVLNWSIDRELVHLEVIEDSSERSGIDSEEAKPSKLSLVIWLVSSCGLSVFSWKKKQIKL